MKLSMYHEQLQKMRNPSPAMRRYIAALGAHIAAASSDDDNVAWVRTLDESTAAWDALSADEQASARVRAGL